MNKSLRDLEFRIKYQFKRKYWGDCINFSVHPLTRGALYIKVRKWYHTVDLEMLGL